MAKIEARELQLRESVVDMADIVADGVKLTASRAAERGVVVVSRVEGESIRIRGDAQRLRQIVLNLMSNAIKFTAAGGRVWIEASIDAGGRPTLIVSDSGIGMSQEEVQVALTPFRQVESPFTREHEGTGLGLPIVMALAELHGGYLKVESERGVGTRVIVSLPGARLVMGPVSALKAAAG
jgi:signal transduction histidine kinase